MQKNKNAMQSKKAVDEFFTASKYWGSGLKIDVVVFVVVIKLLSNSSAFVKFWRELKYF